MSNKWCTIESDPGVFTELIQAIGVQKVQVEELMTLDDSELDAMKPIYGLIFLFKWVKDTQPRNVVQAYDHELFFAQQVVMDACATQAILSVLLNCKDIEIGETLTNFKKFCEDLDSNARGWAIGNSDKIREAHNSFTPQDFFFYDEDNKPKGKEKDVFHFITYIPHKGLLYELDGLQAGPILLGECNESNWLQIAREEITKRIEKYAQTEIRFNLLAVISDRRDKAKKDIEHAEKVRAAANLRLNNEATEVVYLANPQGIDEQILASLPADKEALQNVVAESGATIARSEEILFQENEKHAGWKNDNIRRKHNYTPLIFDMLRILAEKNELGKLVNEAEEKQKKRLEELEKLEKEGKQ